MHYCYSENKGLYLSLSGWAAITLNTDLDETGKEAKIIRVRREEWQSAGHLAQKEREDEEGSDLILDFPFDKSAKIKQHLHRSAWKEDLRIWAVSDSPSSDPAGEKRSRMHISLKPYRGPMELAKITAELRNHPVMKDCWWGSKEILEDKGSLIVKANCKNPLEGVDLRNTQALMVAPGVAWIQPAEESRNLTEAIKERREKAKEREIALIFDVAYRKSHWQNGKKCISMGYHPWEKELRKIRDEEWTKGGLAEKGKMIQLTIGSMANMEDVDTQAGNDILESLKASAPPEIRNSTCWELLTADGLKWNNKIGIFPAEKADKKECHKAIRQLLKWKNMELTVCNVSFKITRATIAETPEGGPAMRLASRTQ